MIFFNLSHHIGKPENNREEEGIADSKRAHSITAYVYGAKFHKISPSFYSITSSMKEEGNVCQFGPGPKINILKALLDILFVFTRL